MNEPTQTEIAAELGLSKAALSKLKKAGMPVHSADAARAWRAAHLHPGRVRDDPGPSPRTLIERASALIPLACQALEAGRFDLVAGELRRAMRAVPVSHRAAVSIPLELWEALIGAATVADIREGAAKHAAATAQTPTPAGVHDPQDAIDGDAHMSDAECGGNFLYSLACGETRLLPASIR